MSAAKIIEGLKQAIASASCEHDLEICGPPRVLENDIIIAVSSCRKCETRFNRIYLAMDSIGDHLPGRSS